jgi:hypothetical protein
LRMYQNIYVKQARGCHPPPDSLGMEEWMNC